MKYEGEKVRSAEVNSTKVRSTEGEKYFTPPHLLTFTP